MSVIKKDVQTAIDMLQPTLNKTFKELIEECKLLDVGLYQYAIQIQLEFQKVNDNIDVADLDKFCLFHRYFTEQYDELTATNLISPLSQARLNVRLNILHSYAGPYITLVGLRNNDKKIATAALLAPSTAWQNTVDALLAVAAVQNAVMQEAISTPVISRQRIYQFSYKKVKK